MVANDERYRSGSQAEAAVQRSEQKLRTIFEAVADAIIMIDQEGIVQSFNPGAERIFGYRVLDDGPGRRRRPGGGDGGIIRRPPWADRQPGPSSRTR